jgi:hypothetical protein
MTVQRPTIHPELIENKAGEGSDFIKQRSSDIRQTVQAHLSGERGRRERIADGALTFRAFRDWFPHV